MSNNTTPRVCAHDNARGTFGALLRFSVPRKTIGDRAHRRHWASGPGAEDPPRYMGPPIVYVEELAVAVEVGRQYEHDDPFKAAARLHQSRFRARVLQVDYCEYGNRLTDEDGRALLNYYDGLGVRGALRRRYPNYSRRRDADMLRSEHIPLNLLAPLGGRAELTQHVMAAAFGLVLAGPFEIKIEWAPEPADCYLGDRTAFDAYVQGFDAGGRAVGIGIEVKYTERAYRMRPSEAARVRDPESSYWTTTREAGVFVRDGDERLACDDLRQIWRNHLLGLAMIQRGDIADFHSVTLYPAGNEHMAAALHAYRGHLVAEASSSFRGCTFEDYVGCLQGDDEIKAWRQYLMERYLVGAAKVALPQKRAGA